MCLSDGRYCMRLSCVLQRTARMRWACRHGKYLMKLSLQAPHSTWNWGPPAPGKGCLSDCLLDCLSVAVCSPVCLVGLLHICYLTYNYGNHIMTLSSPRQNCIPFVGPLILVCSASLLHPAPCHCYYTLAL